MITTRTKLILTFASLGIMMIACNLTAAGQSSTEFPDSGITAVAQTLEAQQTEVAGRATSTSPIPSPTATLPLPTATKLPTSTPLPTATKTTAPTATPIPCSRAAFISDVTVADGSLLAAGSQFSKVWRLKNNGRCAWTSNYELVYYSGDKMQGASVTKFNTRVEPGESIDVGVKLTAPATKGEYLGYWMLRTKDGELFGLGSQGDKPFWVDIEVVETGSGYVYNFAKNICEASWKDNNSPLPCQGAVGPEDNVVRLSEAIEMETGITEDELGLWINLGKMNQVQGTFPAMVLQSGDRFRAGIGCIDESEDCYAQFSLSYKEVGVGTVIELGSWVEKYDDSTQVVDVDLSSLAGKNVKLILKAESLTNADVIEVFWFVPHVQNP
jgi:hypothetical protein